MQIGIVGAGPAGSIAAMELARAGARVLLFDPSHPREKPCGGGLTGRALALLDGVIDLSALPAACITAARVEGPLRDAAVELVAHGITSASSLVVLSRRVLDAALVDAAVRAGAIFVPQKVVDLTRERTGMAIATSGCRYSVDHVIGADGANSMVRRKLARPFTRRHLSVAAGYFVGGVTSPHIVLTMSGPQPGYLWSFPRPDHLAVGVCASASSHVSSSALLRQTAAWIAQHSAQTPSSLEPYAWPIPSAGHDSAHSMIAGGRGWMLTGDAAGLVDPLTREGIYYALLSGRWAAEALTGRAAREEHYAQRLRDELHPELARAAQLSRLFFTPVFASLLSGALAKSAAIRQVFVDLLSGTQPYRGLRRRLLGTGEWRLAAQTIPLLVAPRFAGTMKATVSPSEI